MKKVLKFSSVVLAVASIVMIFLDQYCVKGLVKTYYHKLGYEPYLEYTSWAKLAQIFAIITAVAVGILAVLALLEALDVKGLKSVYKVLHYIAIVVALLAIATFVFQLIMKSKVECSLAAPAIIMFVCSLLSAGSVVLSKYTK